MGSEMCIRDSSRGNSLPRWYFHYLRLKQLITPAPGTRPTGAPANTLELELSDLAKQGATPAAGAGGLLAARAAGARPRREQRREHLRPLLAAILPRRARARRLFASRGSCHSMWRRARARRAVSEARYCSAARLYVERASRDEHT